MTNTRSRTSLLALLLVAACAAAAGAVRAQSPDKAGGESRVDAFAEYTIGVYKMNAGEVLEAADHLESAWRISGHSSKIGIKLGECYYQLRNFTRCEMVLDDILDREADQPDALLLKARVSYIKRDRRTAVLCLERLREKHGSSFETERLLGNIYYEMNEPEKALAAYGRCVQIDSSYPFILYRYGSLLADAGRMVEAEEAFSRAIKLDPSFAEPAVALAQLLLSDGRDDDAIPVLRRLAQDENASDEVVMTLANLYIGHGRAEEAIAVLEARRSGKPLPRDGEIVLGRLYFDAGRFGEARQVFEALFRHEPASAELARILGEVSLKAGDPRTSRVYFERSIAISPSDFRGYLGMYFAGSSQFTGDGPRIELSKNELAALLGEASRRIPGGEFEPNYMIGLAYLSSDSLAAAKRHLARADAIKPGDRSTLLNLASAYEKLREFDDAEKCVSQIFSAAPADPIVLNFYGYLLAEMKKDLKRAEGMIVKALSEDPDNGYYLDSLGWIYYQMGDYKRAVTELERASERVADDAVILEHLGDAYTAARRFSDALAAYERSNSLQGGNHTILEKLDSARRRVE